MQDKELFFSHDKPEVKGLSGLKPHTNLPFLLVGNESKERLLGQIMEKPLKSYRVQITKSDRNMLKTNSERKVHIYLLVYSFQ